MFRHDALSMTAPTLTRHRREHQFDRRRPIRATLRRRAIKRHISSSCFRPGLSRQRAAPSLPRSRRRRSYRLRAFARFCTRSLCSSRGVTCSPPYHSRWRRRPVFKMPRPFISERTARRLSRTRRSTTALLDIIEHTPLDARAFSGG